MNSYEVICAEKTLTRKKLFSYENTKNKIGLLKQKGTSYYFTF